MIIDLHIHSNNSDGHFSIKKIFNFILKRKIDFVSITDHDSIAGQLQAIELAKKANLKYLTGVELNVTFSYPKINGQKLVRLDFLGYNFNPNDEPLKNKLDILAKNRKQRAKQIITNLNTEFEKQSLPLLNELDFAKIEALTNGVFGRPHIADYLIQKKIVKNRQEAFDKYLMKCDVPKYPLFLEEASKLIRDAGGKLVLAHPNDPHGTSLVTLTKMLYQQTSIVKDFLPLIDGVECWHSRSTIETTKHYIQFAKENKLLMTGGSDCHQKPILMGTIHVPDYVASQFES